MRYIAITVIGILVFYATGSADGIWAQIPVQKIFSSAQKRRVLGGAILTRSYVKDHPGYNLGGTNRIRPPRVPMIPQSLSRYEMLTEERAFIPFKKIKGSTTKFYNSLIRYSRLNRMRYYSRTDKRLQPFILSGWRINSPTAKRKVKDVTYPVPAPHRRHYFQIRDNRFGTMVFQSDLYVRGKDMIFKNTCIHPLSRLAFSISNSREYHLYSCYIYSEQHHGYFYYALHALRIRSSLLLGSGLLNSVSFANRIRAETVHRASMLGLNWGNKVRVK